MGIAVARHFLKHTIDCAYMEVHMPVQAGAEPMDKNDGANVQRRLVHTHRTGAVSLQALRNDPQEDAQHQVEHRSITLHKVAQPLGHREHPLAHRQAGKNMIAEVCRRLYSAEVLHEGHTPLPLRE